MDESAKASESRAASRNQAFDVCKFLLMLWVVWGHLQSTGLVEPSGSLFERLIWRAKVANMPAFFLLSGYFAASTFRSGDWGKILARVVSFAWPRATFAAVFVLFELLLCDVFIQGEGISALFLTIYRSRWFLRTLGTLYLFSAMVYRVGKTDARRWILFGIAYSALLFCPVRLRPYLAFAGGAQVVHMYPYFVLGLMMLRKHEWWKSGRVVRFCALFFVGIVIQEGLCDKIVLSTWKASVDWRHVFLNGHGFLHLLLRTALGVSGTISLLALVAKLLKWVPVLAKIAPLGTTTMGVYIVHERPFVMLAASGLSGIPLPAWTRIPFMLFWFLACHALICAIRRRPTWNTVFFGDENRLSHFFQRFFLLPNEV